MTKVQSSTIYALQCEEYDALGCTALTDERLDELVVTQLNNAGIEVDEDHKETRRDIAAAREAISVALTRWQWELRQEKVE